MCPTSAKYKEPNEWHVDDTVALKNIQFQIGHLITTHIMESD